MLKTSLRSLDHLFLAERDEIRAAQQRMPDEVLKIYERQWKQGHISRAGQKALLAEIKRLHR